MEEKNFFENKEECNCEGETSNHDNCCCHNEESSQSEEQNEMLRVVFDDETEVNCEILGTFEVEGREYIILLRENSEEVFIYRYEQNNEEGKELVRIEDDDEFEKVSNAYYELCEE